jgi:hypothetical protein
MPAVRFQEENTGAEDAGTQEVFGRPGLNFK